MTIASNFLPLSLFPLLQSIAKICMFIWDYPVKLLFRRRQRLGPRFIVIHWFEPPISLHYQTIPCVITYRTTPFSDTIPNCTLSLYIAKHTLLVLKSKKMSEFNHNRASKTVKLRQPIRVEHEKPWSFGSQSDLSITALSLAANQNRALRHPKALGYSWRPFSALS